MQEEIKPDLDECTWTLESFLCLSKLFMGEMSKGGRGSVREVGGSVGVSGDVGPAFELNLAVARD